MIHLMFDAYRSVQSKLDDLKYIYELINKLTTMMNVKPVMPPMLIPYYYGTNAEDNGISAFVILKGGHLTIHTFSYRECYFVDMIYNGFLDSDKFVEILLNELPCTESNINVTNRKFHDESVKIHEIDERKDFGPHLLSKIRLDREVGFEELYDLIDKLPYKICMQPIMRPYIIKDGISDFQCVSAMTLIAESHVAMHYFYNEGIIYFDVFSCVFTDISKIMEGIANMFEGEIEFQTISRGSKHDYKKTDIEERLYRYNDWQENIME